MPEAPDSQPAGGETFIERARRHQIVQATIEVLAAEGATGATFARIAARAGISPSLISYHFATKSALLTRVVTDIIAHMDEFIIADIGDEDDHRLVLRRLVESQVRYVGQHTTRMVALGHIAAIGDPEITGLLLEHRTRTLRELQELLAEGQAAATVADVPTRPAAIALLATLEAVPGELLANPDASADAYGRALADLFDAALTPRPDL